MLELTEAQQTQLAKVLTSQREQIRKLWRDQKVPPEYRAGAMRAINEQTEDRIRALMLGFELEYSRLFSQRSPFLALPRSSR
jgi:hypothetical protein